MSLHSLSSRWEVRQVDDGTLVRVLDHGLDARTALLLCDELFELVEASGRPNLYLDLGAVVTLSSAVLAQLLALDRTLADAGGHLALFSCNACLRELLQATHLTNLLDVRVIPLPTSGRAED